MKNLIFASVALVFASVANAQFGGAFGGLNSLRGDPDHWARPQAQDSEPPADDIPATELEPIVVTARRDRSATCTGDITNITRWACQVEDDCDNYTNFRLNSCNRLKTLARSRLSTANTSGLNGDAQDEYDVMFAASEFNCEQACPSEPAQAQNNNTPSPAASAEGEEPMLSDNTSARYINGGGTGDVATNGSGPVCLAQEYENFSCSVTEICGDGTKSDQCHSSRIPATGAAAATSFVHFKPLQSNESVNFESITSCQTFFGQGSSGGGANTSYTFDLTRVDETKARLCRLVSASCPTNTAAHRTNYAACVASRAGEQLRSVVVGMKKCAAIRAAGKATTEFEGDSKVSSIDGKISCKTHEGLAFDYPSCKSFITWYNTLTATQAGVQMYNEGDKISTGMRAQNEAAQAISTGQGQEAGLEASRKTIMASASAEERNKLFFIAKGTAITTQLLSFVTRDNIEGKCDGSEGRCCKLFDSNQRNDSIKTANNFFPNSGEKDKMIAEVIKAGGEAALAAMKEQELKRQAAALRAIKEQMTAPEDSVDEGLMRFCLQFPQDSKCLGAGNRVISGGSGFKGPSFSGQNMGLGNLGTAISEDLAVEEGSAGAIGGPQNSVGDIGSSDKSAADAKAAFDAPSALKGGGGAPTISGGGGGVGASASANGLSNDPGVEGEKKETPLKMTSKSASYEGGSGYNGGGYRAGAGDKKDAAGNPFASMFGKDKGRSPSAVPEIDSPASDLFTKISNRYGEVQKRKALMEVR